MMKTSIIDPVADSRWDEFVDRQDSSSIFHTSAWARVIQETYDYLPRYYILENDNGNIEAALPLYFIQSRLTGNRLVCLPFSDYCYPLGGNEAVSSLLTSAKLEVGPGRASFLELRGWQNREPPPQMGLVRREYHLLYLIDLEPGTNRLKKGLHHSISRGIGQAEKRGVTVRRTSEEADLIRFYELNVATRKKLGVLPQPYIFFDAIYRHIISKGRGFILLAEWEEKVIAGILFLTHNDTIYYKFNVSDEKHLRKRPNHLAIWEGLKYGCDEGFKHFDFGRCTPEEEGLRLFKTRWGSREIELPYYYFPQVKGITTYPENSPMYRAMKIFSHLIPTAAFRAVGSFSYRHLA
jgi:hypothetical protein